MASKTNIPWTNSTWSTVIGCTKCSPGCQNCYAERMARRFWKKWGLLSPPHHFIVKWFPERLNIPLHWKKPRRIFVCSMGDLFHPDVPFEFADKVFAVMALCPQHVFQCLSKRPKRMSEYINTKNRWGKHILPEVDKLRSPYGSPCEYWWPLSNVWLGVSISTRAEADEKIPILMQIPAAVRWLSAEPLLESIDFQKYSDYINWFVFGCESGPKRRHISINDMYESVCSVDCPTGMVYVKQLEINGKVSHNPEEWPEDLRVREFPLSNVKCV